MASISLDDIADEAPAPQAARRTGRSFAIDELMDMEATPQPTTAARSPLPAFDEMGQPTVPEPPAQVAAMPEPAPFVPQDERTTAGAMGRQFARGAIETAGLVPKGAAALGYQAEANTRDFAARQLQVMDRVDRGELVPEVDDAEGYQHMPPALRAQRRAALQAQVQANATTNAPTPIEQRATFRAGEAIDEFGRTRFPTTREEDAAFLTGQVPRAVGSTFAMAPVALAGAPFGALGRLLAGVGLATTGSGEAAQHAVDRRRAIEDMVRAGDAPSPDAYPSDRQIATAAGQGLAPGALDAAAIDNLLRPVVRAPGFRGLIAAVAKKAVEQGIVEGTTEGVQQVAQNLIQRFGYNPDQATLDQVAENVLVGGAVGVLTGGIAGGAIRPTRGRVDQPPQALPVQEIPSDVSRETVGLASRPSDGTSGAEGGARVEVPQAAPQAAPAALPPPSTPSPEDLQAVIEDPRTVAEIMAERERRAQRQATVAAVEREDGPEAAAAVAKVMDGAGRREAPMQAETVADVDMAAAQAQQPTPAQAEAGNFRKGHVRVQGLDIAIEVPRGGERVGVGPDGRPWSVTMPAHYGYLKAGKDSGDGKIDVFVGDEIDAPRVYVIDQIDPRTGKFDEPKVLLGMDGRETAIAVYEASYSDGSGPARMGAITRMTVAELRAWLRDGNPRKPLAYKPAPATPEPSGVALDDVADAPDPLAAAVAPQDQVPQPPASPTAAPAAFPLQGGQASAAAPPVPAPVQGPAVAPADPLATVRNLASRVGVNLTGAELVDIRELLADGAHPEIALEIALERSGLRGAGEIAEATQEGAPDGQDRAAPDAGAADGTGEVADAQGARAEPADRAAAPEGAQRSDPIAGGEQGQGDARGVEPGASVPTEPTAEPARKPTARERREEKLRQKRDAEIKRREAAKKAIATRKKNAGPLNIVQAIAAAGGMKDAGGDLQAIMGRPNHMVPVFGALRSERGMEPDRAREMLVEAGFLPDGATLNDLYEAIDRTIRGNPVYSERDTNAALDKARERRERRAGEGPSFQRPRAERITVAKDSLSDEQMVIPGAERVAAEGKKAAKAPQRSVAETPLFGGEQAATREVKDEDRKREAGRQGALFQKSQIDTPEFRRWFGDSKVVDKNGQPLVVYHGTPGSSRGPITAFAKNARGGLGGTVGFWFASTRQAAEQFKRPRFAGVEPEMIAAHLSISRPAEFNGYRSFLDAISARPGDSPEKKAASLRRALQRAGHDGIVIRNSDTDRGGLRDDWVAFEPTQIKSATANAGTFNPNDPDIRAQASDRFRVAGQIDAVNSLTPQDRRRRDAVMQAVTTTVRRMAGAATPQTVTADIMEADGQELWGAYSPADHLLAVSTRSPDPIGTVRHETIHVLRQLGLIDGAAWSALEDAAERGDWLTKHEITDRWGDQLTREQALEEAIAEEFGVGLREGVWKTGNARVDAIFQRIAEFFRRVRAEIKRALSAAGMRDLSDADVAEMVFSLIERGAFREGRGATAGQRSVMAQPAWHGSPHTFDRFSIDKIGTGEGAQAYGHGLYFAGRKEVAEHYRSTLSRTQFNYRGRMMQPGELSDDIWRSAAGTIPDNVRASPEFLRGVMDAVHEFATTGKIPSAPADLSAWMGYGPPSRRQGYAHAAAILKDVQPTRGRLYAVELAPAEDEYLLWDRPLSEQSEKVRKILNDNWWAHPQDHAHRTGKQIYDDVAQQFVASDAAWDRLKISPKDVSFSGIQRAASMALRAAGIRGIKYLDGASRTRPMRDIKRAFLEALPEDAGFDELSEMIGDGTFSPQQDEFLRRLQADDWLGFDYPAQAISAALGNDLSGFDPSPELRAAIEALRDDSTYNYVIFDDADVQITAMYQVGRNGVRAAAARPTARRLRDLRSAIADLRGGNNDPLAKVRVPNDIGWARKTMVTPRTIAAYFPSFADVFFAGVRQFRTRDKSISELTEIARPYLDLDQASKEKVNKVVEHGRMAGEVYAPDADGTIEVTNKVGQQIKGKIGGVTLMKDGETITLTPDEARAYRAYRKVMDVALDKFRDQVLREWGFDPADPASPKTADGVDDLVEAEENAGERARLKSLAQVLSSIQQAKKRGYVPFTRYGSHYVTVTTLQDGKRAVVHREHIEPGLTTSPRTKLTRARLEQEAAALRKRLAEIYPPDQGFEVSELREVSPDNIGDLPDFSDLDAIIQAANLPPEQAAKVQQAIGEVIQKRGFRAHFIKSRNIPGYSVDFERSLADYIVGISGYLARREHLPEIEQGIASIPATQPELRRYAKDWNDYIQNPSEEFQGLRQAGFLWYLSGRFSSAVVNLSQIPMVTQPYLSMFAGHAAAAAEVARAYKDAALAVRPKTKAAGGAGLDVFSPDALPEDVRDVVKAALADGTLIPIETFQEMARAKGRTPKSRSIGAKAQAAQDAAAFMFQAGERANRLVSFIAAYRLAQRPEVMGRIRADLRDNPLWTRRRKDRQLGATEFAAFVVEETQFVLGKVNRTRMMRGPGAVIFQFKAFAANYLELMARLGAFGSGVHRGGRRYAALASMMFAMFLVGGLFGLPSAEDGLEMIEALIKTATGIDPQFEDGLRESAGSLAAWAARQLGADDETQAGVSAVAGRVAARGVARETGIDVSQRIGMGRVAPKPTGTEQDDFWYRAIGLAGIPGSWILRGVDTGYAVARGDWLQAGIRLAPEAIADQMRAYQLADEGVKTIAKGRKVITPDETLPDGTVAGGASNVAKRVLGFQPTGISRAREQMNAIRRAGEAPRDLFADFNLRRANIQAAINRASDTLENATSDKERASAKAAVERETKRLERVMAEIEAYNASAPSERAYRIDNPGYKQQLRIANQGQRATQIKKVPMRVRGGIEDIRARY